MNSKRGLMTVLVGVAMLAMPLTAAAKDHGRFRNEFRNGATWVPAQPTPVNRDEWRENHRGSNDGDENHRGWNEGDADEYRNYGNRGYYPAPVYAAPVYQGYGYGGGRGCAQAQQVMRTYERDRATGHPAAAADLLRQNQWALRSGCGASAYGNYGGYNGGLLGGLGGLGGYQNAPAYGNYGGYNTGYGQPYGNGSMLAPLLQYIR
jgi:hypothetical protein